MSSDRGFTLIEVLVAMVIGASMVLAVGLSSETLVRRRSANASISAATSLAERQMEQLLAKQSPASDADLTAGIHGPNPCASPPCKIDETGAATLNGPYLMQWTVVDNSNSSGKPLLDPSGSTKQITTTVTHVTNPYARATLVTYYKVQ